MSFDNQFARVLSELAVPWQADETPDPRLLLLNESLAAELGLDLAWLRGDRESAYRRLTDQVATLAYDPRLTRRLALMASDLGDWDAALAHLQRLTEAGDLTGAENIV